MLRATASALRCVSVKKSKAPCGGDLEVHSQQSQGEEVVYGSLICSRCESKYPILSGVAIVVSDVREYVLSHAKGIAKVVPLKEIPGSYRREFSAVLDELKTEHIEEDLESDRVNSLYLMSHYLRIRNSENRKWWIPETNADPLMHELISRYWDHGPFHQIEKWISSFTQKDLQVVELGCGVGGLARVLAPSIQRYLGVDSSFASIHLARALNVLGKKQALKIPGDLLHGALSQEVQVEPLITKASIDFVVGEIEGLSIQSQSFDLSVALNAIDMLDDPSSLPRSQHAILRPGGIAIQSCPYIWHEAVARKIRSILPKVKDSAAAAEALYERVGFKILKREDHVPWLFLKHYRQLEIYSVHIFMAKA